MARFPAGVAVLFCGAWAGAAWGQGRPPNAPGVAPQVPDAPGAPTINPPYNPSYYPASYNKSLEEGTSYLEFLAGGLVVFGLTWAVFRASAYFAQRRDPAAYILNDPWVRTNLERKGAPPGQPPPEPPG